MKNGYSLAGMMGLAGIVLYLLDANALVVGVLVLGGLAVGVWASHRADDAEATAARALREWRAGAADWKRPEAREA